MRLTLEFVIAEPKRLSRPEKRAAAEQPHSYPVIGLLWVVCVRNFLLVYPRIRVELVRLKDMGQEARLLEPAKGQGVGRFQLRVLVNICDRSRVEHQA